MAKKPAGKAVLSLKDLDKQMMADASDATARTATVGGNTIGTANRKFSYKNQAIGKSLEVVVVDFVQVNSYYDTPYDEQNPAPPACVAISVDGDEMAPVNESPSKQAEQCDGCWANAWASAEVGRGKACGEQYKLAVVAVGPGEDYSTADMATLTLAPTSRNNWTQYVQDIADKLQRAPWGVLTEFTFDDYVLVPEFMKKVGSATDLNDINDRRDEARRLLLAPPDFAGFVKPTSKKKAKKKKAAKKKASKKTARKKVSKKTARKKAAKKKTGSKFG